MGIATHNSHRITLGKEAFMNKKKLFTGNFSIELKKRIVKSVLWNVAFRSMVSESSKQKEIRSHENVDLEKDGEN